MFFDIIEYEITLKVISGLYIGGGDAGIRIGGVDNEFIKHPINKLPYIPGSSLKGKIRSLLEYDAGILSLRCTNNNKPSGEVLSLEDYKTSSAEQKIKIKHILMLFGVSASEFDKEIGVTRLSFSDLELTDKFKNDNLSVYEIKAETAIDRIKGTAKNGSLRFTERVGEGITFKGIISMKKFTGDDDSLEQVLFKGIKLLMKDTLGGSGSRGYGRIEISFNDKKINERFNNFILG